MKKLKSALCVLTVSLLLSGCVFLVAGTVGAVGGYAITRDTIKGEYDVRYSAAWKSAVDVCVMLGTVTLKDKGRGTIDAVIDQAKVKVEISQLTPDTVRIKVKARKGIFPRIGTAEMVFIKIVQRFR